MAGTSRRLPFLVTRVCRPSRAPQAPKGTLDGHRANSVFVAGSAYGPTPLIGANACSQAMSAVLRSQLPAMSGVWDRRPS
jgi:hypothetical protein